MNFERLARDLRASTDWREENQRVADLVRQQPRSAIELAAVLDDELTARGFDLAVRNVRSGLLESVARLSHEEATAVAVQLAQHPPMSHPSAHDPGYRRSRGAMLIAGIRSASEIWDA
jgi:hypothetical protein